MGSGHLKPIFSLRLNSIPSPDFSVCWDLLGIKVLTGDEYSTIQGVARIFPEVRTIFQPPPAPNLTGRRTHIDIIVLSFVYYEDRPEWK